MIAVDTNVLVMAHRAESPQHAITLARLTSLANREVPWALPVFCIAEFVRVVTHRRVFDPPTDLTTALRFIEGLLEAPSARLLLPTDAYPREFARVSTDAKATGNLTFDAQIATVCAEHGVREIITADRDFARFDGLSPIFI